MTFSQKQILTSELCKPPKQAVYNTNTNRHAASMQWCFQVMLPERLAKYYRNDKMMLDGRYEPLTKACEDIAEGMLKLGDIYSQALGL